MFIYFPVRRPTLLAWNEILTIPDDSQKLGEPRTNGPGKDTARLAQEGFQQGSCGVCCKSVAVGVLRYDYDSTCHKVGLSFHFFGWCSAILVWKSWLCWINTSNGKKEFSLSCNTIALRQRQGFWLPHINC